jgi:hypothetical protein
MYTAVVLILFVSLAYANGDPSMLPGQTQLAVGVDMLSLHDQVPVFVPVASCDKDHETPDSHHYCFYDWLNYEELNECDFTATTVMVSTYAKFVEAFSAFVEVDTFMDLFGSASTGFKYAFEMFASGKFSATISYLQCKYAKVAIYYTNPPPVPSPFVSSIMIIFIYVRIELFSTGSSICASSN